MTVATLHKSDFVQQNAANTKTNINVPRHQHCLSLGILVFLYSRQDAIIFMLKANVYA
jgi:hypothetical protein